jgi:hypothetical protein
MLHHRVRSLRTVLIATALTSAIASPAAAATAATPIYDSQAKAATARTIGTTPKKLHRTRKAIATRTFRYDIKYSRKKNSGRAFGTIEWSDAGASNDGKVRDNGPGRTFVHFYGYKRSDGSQVTLRQTAVWANDRTMSTDWETTEDLKKIVIASCKYWDPDDDQDLTCTERPYNLKK